MSSVYEYKISISEMALLHIVNAAPGEGARLARELNERTGLSLSEADTIKLLEGLVGMIKEEPGGAEMLFDGSTRRVEIKTHNGDQA